METNDIESTGWPTPAFPAGAASAAFAGFTHHEAAARIAQGLSEPLLGALDGSQVQLCPQNSSTLGEEECARLREDFPSVAFRVHANASCGGKFGLHDASSDWSSRAFQEWKAMLRRACQALDAPAYSWHAGRSTNASLSQALARTKDLEQELGIPVGIEGLYPSAATPWLMSSFEDYRAAMASGAAFAIDLSHWQIVAKASGRREMGLLRDLLSHPRCVEIHISDNDGVRDNHRKLERQPFWFGLLCELSAKKLLRADIFSEGLQASNKQALAERSGRGPIAL